MVTMAGAGPGQSEEPGISPGSLKGGDPRTKDTFHCFSKHHWLGAIWEMEQLGFELALLDVIPLSWVAA